MNALLVTVVIPILIFLFAGLHQVNEGFVGSFFVGV
jgi:hypothetical protein